MTTDTERFAGSECYDSHYFGNAQPYTANYVNYNERSTPHWATPLAQWIADHGDAPVLEVGCAYGFLVRELNRLGMPAFGIDWSKWATDRRVDANVERMDARKLRFDDGIFGTIVSLDLLEHFEIDDTLATMDEMIRAGKRDLLMVHVIGAHNPAEDISRHMSDPTHVNHEPLEWYLNAFADRGVAVAAELTDELKRHSAWTATDWRDRIIAFRRIV